MSKPKHYQIAEKYIGLKEIEGPKHNETIVNFHKRISGTAHPDETSWCAAFVGCCLLDAGLPSSGSLAARSYQKYGDPALKPQIGDIVVFTRGNKNSWQGHVGFYAGEKGDYIMVLGGNQGNQVCVRAYPKSRLLATRRAPKV
ncbi:MAG: TIGR02594 family protein [Lachnospiraceae bacterium]|nr:TIGR02594 family protein [Lachnospiraceae bacterium]